MQSLALLSQIADGLEVPRGWVGLAYDPDPDLEPEPGAPDNAATLAAAGEGASHPDRSAVCGTGLLVSGVRCYNTVSHSRVQQRRNGLLRHWRGERGAARGIGSDAPSILQSSRVVLGAARSPGASR